MSQVNIENPSKSEEKTQEIIFSNIQNIINHFLNSQSEEEKVNVIHTVIDNINADLISIQEVLFSEFFQLILPYTFPLQNEEIRRASLSIILKLSEYQTEKCILSCKIFDFCINSICGYDDQYLKYIFAALANLVKNDIYHRRLVEEVDPSVFCSALTSEITTEMNLKTLYILLHNIFKKDVAFVYAEIIANALNEAPNSSNKLSLIYTMVSQHRDIIYSFTCENLLQSISEQLRKANKEESLSAVCLLSLMIVSDVKFTFDFGPLFDLTSNNDIQLKAAAFNCIYYLSNSNNESTHVCLENNLFPVCAENINQDSPEAIRKEALRCILGMITFMTRNEIETYLTPSIIETMVNFLDYDDDIELIVQLLKAMNIILLPSCGPVYDALMGALEELNGWERITELMNSHEKEKEDLKQEATIFYHNNHEEPINYIDIEENIL